MDSLLKILNMAGPDKKIAEARACLEGTCFK